MSALPAGLASIVGAAHVLLSPEDCAPYLSDWRGRYAGKALCVVRPGSTAEVAAVVSACAAAGVSMVPQGGNTGLVGGGVPRAAGDEVLVSLSRLDRVRQVDVANDTLTVEAGCTLASVQAVARAHERLFPLSLASEGSCQIGGNLSSNAGGVHVLRYGNARDLTLGLEVVLPDGRIWDGLRALRKDNTGYDLKQLFIGAEGTLGIITAAVLKLYPLPRSRCVAWLSLPDAQAAMTLLARAQDTFAERLAAYEIIGRSALELVFRHLPGARDPLSAVSPWYALLELDDPRPDAGLEDVLMTGLQPALEEGLVLDAVLSVSEQQARDLWALRENLSEAQRREGVSLKHDVSLPRSVIPDFLRVAEEALSSRFTGLRVVCFGHAGDGNLHYNLSCADPDENGRLIEQGEAVSRIVHDVVVSFGGSISAEHGLGQLKREEIVRYKSVLEIDLMRTIKDAFDPRGLMNPGKLI